MATTTKQATAKKRGANTKAPQTTRMNMTQLKEPKAKSSANTSTKTAKTSMTSTKTSRVKVSAAKRTRVKAPTVRKVVTEAAKDVAKDASKKSGKPSPFTKTVVTESRDDKSVDGILSGEGATVDEVVEEVMTPQKKRRERRSELAALEWKRYQRTGDPDTRRRLLGLYLPLVRSVAGRMAMGFPRSVDIQDLINTGVLGLSEAFKKFDPDRGVKFETYAVPRIRGAILDELRALDWVPRSTRSKARNIDKATVSLENDHGRPPTEDELAEHLECTHQELMTAMGDVSSATILSLDEVIYRDEENRQVPRIESVEDPSETSVLKQVLKEEMRTFLRVAISNLTEQEKLVIALYYFEELTLKEIGSVMKISESRVSQIHTKGVGKLRGLIQERYSGSNG